MSREACVRLGGGNHWAATRLRARAVRLALEGLPERCRPASVRLVSAGMVHLAWSDTATNQDARSAVQTAESVLNGWRANDALVADLEYVLGMGVECHSGLSGIRTEWNWSCCQPCGVSELREAFESGDCSEPHYAFCHMQDVDHIGSEGDCCLCYGSFDPDADAVSVGRRVAEALRDLGFVVEWNGEASRRIRIRLDVRGMAITRDR
jgi:hypothetical protein